ncbi:MAG: hypothetical protein QN160_08965, partial [Armatimonadota bacterium]|nr:hypothetical protein [Armatimonadota bacterium]
MRILVLGVSLLLPLASAAAAAAGVLEVRATLTGEVLADGLVRPGQEVRDGDPLVYVRALVGRAVAARAPADGTVVEVLVRPGQQIRERGM